MRECMGLSLVEFLAQLNALTNQTEVRIKEQLALVEAKAKEKMSLVEAKAKEDLALAKEKKKEDGPAGLCLYHSRDCSTARVEQSPPI